MIYLGFFSPSLFLLPTSLWFSVWLFSLGLLFSVSGAISVVGTVSLFPLFFHPFAVAFCVVFYYGTSCFFLYPSSLHYSFHIYFILHGYKSCFLKEYWCGRSLLEVHCRFNCCVEYLLDLLFFFFCRVPWSWAVAHYWDDCCFDALPYRFHSHSLEFFVSCFW